MERILYAVEYSFNDLVGLDTKPISRQLHFSRGSGSILETKSKCNRKNTGRLPVALLPHKRYSSTFPVAPWHNPPYVNVHKRRLFEL